MAARPGAPQILTSGSFLNAWCKIAAGAGASADIHVGLFFECQVQSCGSTRVPPDNRLQTNDVMANIDCDAETCKDQKSTKRLSKGGVHEIRFSGAFRSNFILKWSRTPEIFTSSGPPEIHVGLFFECLMQSGGSTRGPPNTHVGLFFECLVQSGGSTRPRDIHVGLFFECLVQSRGSTRVSPDNRLQTKDVMANIDCDAETWKDRRSTKRLSKGGVHEIRFSGVFR